MSLPGITINPIRVLDGGHHFNEVVSEDAIVQGDMLLGEKGNGWHQVTAEPAFLRSGPERFLSTYPLVAGFGRRVAESGDSAALAALGRLSARLLALRQMSLRIAGALDRDELPNIPAALMPECPSRLDTTAISTPAASMIEACACRRSCSRTRRNPASATRRLKVLETASGLRCEPS